MNYLYQLIASVCIGIISFGLSLFIARQIGATHFGQYSTALAIGSILAIGLDGGMRNLIIRERTRMSEQHLVRLRNQLPHIAMGYSLLAAILASIICAVTFSDQLYLGLGVIWCFWGSVITQYASAILRGDGKLKTDLLWQLKQRLLTATFIIVTVILGYFEVWQLLLTWGIGALCANLFFKEGFRFSPTFKPLLSLEFKLYRTLLPLMWIDLATTVYFRSDLIMLQSLKVTNIEIGQYAAAYRLIEAIILLVSPISIIVFRKVRLLEVEKHLQRKYIVQSLMISMFIGIIGVAGMQITASTLVQLSYGEQYVQSTALLIMLSWMIAFLIPNTVLTQTALALNLEKAYALTATFAAISNIGLNLIFIPEYGVIASAYSSIATELIILIGLFTAIFKKIRV